MNTKVSLIKDIICSNLKLTLLYLFLATVGILLSLTQPLLMKYIIDDIIPTRNIEPFFKFATFAISLIFLSIIVSFANKIIFHHLFNLILFCFKKITINGIMNTSYLDYIGKKQGEYLNIIQKDSYVVSTFIMKRGFQTLFDIVSICTAMYILLRLNLKITFISFTIMSFLVVIQYFVRKKLEYLVPRLYTLTDKLSQRLIQILNGIDTIRYFSIQSAIEKKYSDVVSDHITNSKKMTTIEATSSILVGGGSSLVAFIIFMYIVYLSFQGQGTLGQAMVFYSYLGKIFSPIASMSDGLVEYQRFKASINRITETTSHNQRNHEVVPISEQITFQEVLEFKNVNFSYKKNDPVIKDLDFIIKRGERIVITGPSGSGKSTLAKLLVKLFEPDSGIISIDRNNFDELSISQIRSAITYVDQDTFLFNDSVLFNLTLGNKSISNEQIQSICTSVNIQEIIESLGSGINTEIGERGLTLSGGEKQRFVFARAMLKQSDIVIFDESTSNLDKINSLNIKNLLKGLGNQKTIIFITHDLSLLEEEFFDKILVLNKGRLEEMGTHQKLLADKQLYYSLWRARKTSSSQMEVL